MKHILEKHAPFLVIIILLVIGLIYFTVFRAPAQEELTFVEAGEDLPTNCVPPGETLTGDQVHCVRRAAGAILGEDALNASEEDGDFGKSLCISSLGKVITCGGETDETTNIGSGTAAEAPVGTVVSVRASPTAPTAPVIYAESETDSAINVEIKSLNTTATNETKFEFSADSVNTESSLKHYVNGAEEGKLTIDENGIFKFGNSLSVDGYSTHRSISSDNGAQLFFNTNGNFGIGTIGSSVDKFQIDAGGLDSALALYNSTDKNALYVGGGYLRLSSVSGAPAVGDCSISQVGRMIVDSNANNMYVCASDGTWKTIAL